MTDFAIPTDGLKEQFEQELENQKRNIGRPNMLLIGQTGVGKSSLINTVFGKELAKVSHVKPETRGFHSYSYGDIPINIIDSEGYELDKSELFMSLLEEEHERRFTNLKEQIHIAWYCISISGSRVLPYDIKIIRFVKEKLKIPIAIVFTQCDNDTPEGDIAKSLEKVINENFKGYISCFQVSNDKQLNEDLDLNKLTEWSINNLSEENLKMGFLIAQNANLQLKAEKAKSVIKYYATAAAAIGGSPIPMSDAVLLTGLQTTMAAQIFNIYGLNNSLPTVLKQVIQGRIVSIIGKSLAGNLLKFIPGLGTIAGAAINAAVATTITYSMGYALMKLCKIAIEKILNGETFEFENIFNNVNIDNLITEYKNQKSKS